MQKSADRVSMADHEGKGGQAPPSGTPPLSGTLGAPSAHRFAARCRARDLGKTTGDARAKPLLAATRPLFAEGGACRRAPTA